MVALGRRNYMFFGSDGGGDSAAVMYSLIGSCKLNGIEPEAWLRNDHLGIDLWIELGLPDERRLKKACTQSAEVALFAYNQRAAEIWWQQNKSKCGQFKNLTVWYLDDEQLAQLSEFASRTMTLQATIQEGAIWLSDSQNNLEIHLAAWQPAS